MGRVALILKLHHVMADDPSAIQMMASLFDFAAQAEDPPSEPWKRQVRKDPSTRRSR